MSSSFSKPEFVLDPFEKKIILKIGNLCLRDCHEASFDWKFLKIGSCSVRDLIKNVPVLQVGWLAPTPPTLSVIRVVLLHTEGQFRGFQFKSLIKYPTLEILL